MFSARANASTSLNGGPYLGSRLLEPRTLKPLLELLLLGLDFLHSDCHIIHTVECLGATLVAQLVANGQKT
jgi:hypothetical protein